MKLPRLLSILVLIAVLLTACGGAPTPEAPQYEVALTGAVETMVAAYFGTLTAVAPVATATSLPPTPTSSPPPSPTPFPNLALTPSLTPTLAWIPVLSSPTPTGTRLTPTTNPGSLASGCNNLAVLGGAEISGGDNVQPGEDFTVTWSVQNTGTCAWEFNYHLVQISGPEFDMVGGHADRNIPPGNKGTITVKLQAPHKNGNASGSFRFATGAGQLFGETMTVTVDVGGGGGSDDPTTEPPTSSAPTTAP
jgi:hypothetical protein